MTFQSDSEHNPFANNPPEPTEQPPVELTIKPLPEQWRIRDLLIFIGVGLVSLLATGPIAIIGYYVAVAPFVGKVVPFQELRTNVIFGLSVQLLWYGFLLVCIYLFIRFYYKDSFVNALKWNKLSLHSTVRYLLGGAGLSLIVMIIPPLLPQKKGFPLEKMFNSPSSAYAIAAFAVLVAPFMEELLFRGVLFAFFEKHGGLSFAIGATAVLFAGLHIPEYWGAWNNVVMILVVGLTFSLVRGLTGSLTPSFVLHLAYNGTLMFLLFLQTQHFHKMPTSLLIFR
jgi:membrane protease YdiL (CAAX protease family)